MMVVKAFRIRGATLADVALPTAKGVIRNFRR